MNWHRGIVQLPEGRSRVRLEFTPVRRDRNRNRNPYISTGMGEAWTNGMFLTHDWTPDRIAYQQEYEGGLLEIEASGPQVSGPIDNWMPDAGDHTRSQLSATLYARCGSNRYATPWRYGIARHPPAY